MPVSPFPSSQLQFAAWQWLSHCPQHFLATSVPSCPGCFSKASSWAVAQIVAYSWKFGLCTVLCVLPQPQPRTHWPCFVLARILFPFTSSGWIPQWRSVNLKTILWKNLVGVLHGGTSVTARILLGKLKNACAMIRNVLRSVSEAQVSYSGISCVHRGSKNHRADVTVRVFRKPNHWEAFPKGEPSSRERWFLYAWETDFWH